LRMDRFARFILLLSVLSLTSATTFTYVQDYIVGDPVEDGSTDYDVDLASQIQGNVILIPYLAGETIQWIVKLSNFNISFNGENSEVLQMSCTVFMNNPILNTLLLEEEDPADNRCPDEFKAQISSAILSDSLYNESPELHSFANFADSKCPPVTTTKRVNGSDCVIQTMIHTLNNCTATPQRSNLVLQYFKHNFTITAVFSKCDLSVTELKELQTERFYVNRNGSYIQINERFVQIDDDDSSNEIITPKNLTKQINFYRYPDPSVEWFEVFSLINAIYAPEVTYEALADWVFA